MVHLWPLFSVVQIFIKVKNSNLIEILSSARDVALVYVVIFRLKAHVSHLFVKTSIDQINFSQLRFKIKDKNALFSVTDEKPLINIELYFFDKTEVLRCAVILDHILLLITFKVFNLLYEPCYGFDFKYFNCLSLMVVKPEKRSILVEINNGFFEVKVHLINLF